jgi:hypothetical protein
MPNAYQIVAMTDRRTEAGEREVEIYAAIADSPEQALTLARERLPVGWDVALTPGFLYAPAAVDGIEPGELHQMH